MAAREVQVILSSGVALLLAACAAAYADTVNFTYSGANGPSAWGSLCPQYRLCSEGKRQSPINIVNADAEYNPKLIRLRRNYRACSNATLLDNHCNIALRYDEDVGYVVVEGKKYSLLQMHWHSPSEHTIDGERFPVELHLVHKSVDGNITVVAVLYQFGRADPLLIQLKDKMAELKKEVLAGDEQARVPVGVVKMRSLKQHTRKYYRYVGSLSTPPCTENVVWNVLGEARKMSRRQAAELQAPLKEAYRRNARPAQALNGRVVQVYDESRSQ
ncbi:alpha carbonic anhydrase 1, chloroplastic-like isoform X1 [Zingiber officinale]|uniref:alpha carbonic anhydrase 1, chloroplastic-like isoform X1 n=1 Tax=Zingiber officinale TaxID=94328 RepID=UPI001C4B67C5|nr:alpha carbonic anhydrase 1, chloroplastic-like isoform X1 [Zingiber officinale]